MIPVTLDLTHLADHKGAILCSAASAQSNSNDRCSSFANPLAFFFFKTPVSTSHTTEEIRNMQAYEKVRRGKGKKVQHSKRSSFAGSLLLMHLREECSVVDVLNRVPSPSSTRYLDGLTEDSSSYLFINLITFYHHLIFTAHSIMAIEEG